MFTRIIIGVLIGLAAGYAVNGKVAASPKTVQMLQIFAGIVAVAFIASSFMFGPVMGVFAAIEVAGGYFLYTQVIKPKMDK
ncbi:hypothetical protein SJI00_13490 [Pseudomonas sp. RP23018S]|uniref:hypothetical protein n=1 Tax=Pseudomonas sp. RP23018S TaxID=3096037 RepID=UPI002ACA3970|nr:hypothetical protein [Pseudomonas sp. RP23018S]MDZ5603791.1 hypothetical protein [Pseudomonas sp. RP23018S]